jgi:hypothetical protein
VSADPPEDPEPETPVRVASVPWSGRYVDAVLPPGTARVGPATEPSPWLDASYLAEHAAELDVLHLHGGFAHLSAAELEEWTAVVRRLGVPLVVTVHQLRAADPEAAARLDAHLRILLSTAEVVLTLTPGAADDIAVRYGRTAIVIAHPSIAAPLPDRGAERGLVGVLLGPAAGPGAGQVVRAALSGALSGGGRLRVLVRGGDVQPEVAVAGHDGALEVVACTDDDWVAQVQQLHVAVLAEHCGTHSTDLEICRDVGTRVVAPSCGWFADQWSEVVTYVDDESRGVDAVSLGLAVAAALARPVPRPESRDWRARQRAAVQRVHAEVYAQVAADRSWA